MPTRSKPTSGKSKPSSNSKAQGNVGRAQPQTIVFSGPSVPAEEVRRFVPRAEVRRPIRRGDLEDVQAPTLVAIIDGVFDAELSVSPREIRTALARGVRIVGSSSMGALRAAEVPRMLGVGRIYEMYRQGRLRRDDEVAILLDNETGRALTEPLVNVRFAVDRLVSTGTLSPSHGSAIIDAASNLHFHDRTYRNILRRAGLSGLADVETLLHALKAVDLKREDAISLLEKLDDLGRDPSWNVDHDAVDPKREVHDDLDSIRIRKTEPADAPLRIWEYGEEVDFRGLLRFIALTGRLDSYARGALVRFLLDDGAIPKPRKRPRSKVANPQELFEDIWDVWGWSVPEEVHVTLHDLGVGLKSVSEYCEEEHQARLRLTSLYETMPKRFMHALRTELLGNEMALKREAMRYGALRALAKNFEGDVSNEQRREAKQALLGTAVRYLWVETWEDLLARHGMGAADADTIVDLVARARARGTALLEAWETPGAVRSSEPAGVKDLPIARFKPGTRRSMDDVKAVKVATRLGQTIGVTRVAQLSELDRIGGLHVTSVYRPSKWSSALGSGKSERLEGAIVGGIMEEVEKYCQEVFEPEDEVRRAYVDWLPGEALDPARCQLPYDSNYDPSRPIDWTWATDLVSGQKIQVPTSTLVFRRTPNDPLFSQRLASREFSSNGLASGFSVTEAVVHALCEIIERHSNKLAEQELNNPGDLAGSISQRSTFVDLASCPESTRRICDAIRAGDREIRVMNITCEIGIPTFSARIMRPLPLHGAEGWAHGWAAHPNAEFALNRAILEAVQTVIMNVSGAREDLALRVRSLGRHERPRPNTLGVWEWFVPWVPKCRFDSIPTFHATNAREELAYVVNRLVAASYDKVLFRDLSRDETKPAAVVRVLVPGTEGIATLHTGLRARVHAVQDLLHRQAW